MQLYLKPEVKETTLRNEIRLLFWSLQQLLDRNLQTALGLVMRPSPFLREREETLQIY